MNPLYGVIMAGGAGTRFWPLSRRLHPKQFLPLGRDGNEPLIAATARRIEPLIPASQTLVVTAAALADITRSTLPKLPNENILLEPIGRNTAPCVGWASQFISQKDPNAIAVVLASDAYIADDAAFLRALETAAIAAEKGSIVTIGIRPTRPETGYGYLQVGKPTDVVGAFRVDAFVEKPDRARAESYVSDGRHLWNAGIFVFRVDVMLRAIEQHIPELATALHSLEAITTRYPTLPNVSIDVGVMEKVEEVIVVPVDCGWSDVGSWQAAWELGDRDDNGNVVRADANLATVIDARGNMIVAPPGKAIAVIGIDDLIVVDTPDALLVAPRSRAQDVKRAVDALTQRGQKNYV